MNNKIKRVVAVLAVLLLLVSAMPAAAGDASSHIKGEVKHERTVTLLPHPGGEILIVSPILLYEGDTVEFIAAPADGWALRSLRFYTTDETQSTDITAAMKLTMPDADVKVAAEFVRLHSVTFNMMGYGEQLAQIKDIQDGSLVPRPVSPTAQGRSFGGWYKNDACTEAWNFGNDRVSGSTTLYAKWIADTVPVCKIGGTVSESGTTVPGAIVELFSGDEKTAAAVTDENGSYSLYPVETGNYNIVVTSPDGKVSTGYADAEAPVQNQTNVELPTQNVSSVVDHIGKNVPGSRSDVNGAVVRWLERAVEKEQPEGDERVKLNFSIEPVAYTGTAAQDAIIGISGENLRIDFFELTLTRQVNQEAPVDFGNMNSTLFSILIPFDFTDVSDGSVKVFRFHNGKAEAMTKDPASDSEGYSVDDSEVNLLARGFSTYAIAYILDSDVPCSHSDTNKDHLCDSCGERISEHEGKRQKGLAPTSDQPGFRDYYRCGCGRYFEDAECMTEIDDLNAWKAEGGRGYMSPLGNNPPTGDVPYIVLWCCVAAVSLYLLTLTLIKRNKNES